MAGPYYTAEQWARDVLAGLGNTNPTQQQLDFLKGWQISEGGGYAPTQAVPSYNPINTSEPAPGSTCQNCNIGYHVQNYPNYQTGLAAILKNLQGGYYPDIVKYLRGQPYNSAALIRQFNMFICGTPTCHGYPYGTYGPAGLAARGAGTNAIIPGYRPQPPVRHVYGVPNSSAHAFMHGPVPPGGYQPAPGKQQPIPAHKSRGTFFGIPQIIRSTFTPKPAMPGVAPTANTGRSVSNTPGTHTAPIVPPKGPTRSWPTLHTRTQSQQSPPGHAVSHSGTNKATGLPAHPPAHRAAPGSRQGAHPR